MVNTTDCFFCFNSSPVRSYKARVLTIELPLSEEGNSMVLTISVMSASALLSDGSSPRGILYFSVENLF